MKVLFLDIDGVCNCEESFKFQYRGFTGIDPNMAFLVGKIVLYTDCEVVLSSSWRHSPESVKEVEAQVVKLLGVTPDSAEGFRGDEVKAWLAEHPEVTRYAILDDDGDFYPDQNLFQTTWKTGITEEIADKVIHFLNETEGA